MTEQMMICRKKSGRMGPLPVNYCLQCKDFDPVTEDMSPSEAKGNSVGVCRFFGKIWRPPFAGEGHVAQNEAVSRVRCFSTGPDAREVDGDYDWDPRRVA